MNNWKIGDKVQSLETHEPFLTKGKTYVIKEKEGSRIYITFDDGGYGSWVDNDVINISEEYTSSLVNVDDLF
tara:strand:- start:492 stop:707 length:216 start_codon:yes stop_codon:yes gene_type:complete